MSQAKPRKRPRNKPAVLNETQDGEWLGGEAHVPYHDRPLDLLTVLRTDAAGFTRLAVGLAFFTGVVIGSTFASLIVRNEKI